MANLHAFPLDTVKIDRSFVQRLGDNAEEATSVIRAIIMLSNSLHLEVTGEGIETLDHVSLLQNLGCNLGQGYYFAAPLSAADITTRMADTNTTFLCSTESGDLRLIQPEPGAIPPMRLAA